MKGLLHRALDIKALPLVLIVAAVLRLAMYPFIGAMNQQSWEYEWIANQMVQGHGYGFPWGVHNGVNYILPTAFMPPGQVMLDYFPLAIFGTGRLGHGFLFLEQVVLTWAFVWIGFKLLESLFDNRRIAILGAWLLAIYPSFVVSAGSFGISAAVLLLDATLLWLLVTYFKAANRGLPAMKTAAAIGVICGLLTFFRSEAYLVLTVSFLALFGRFRRDLRGRTKEFAVMIVMGLMIVSPWFVRNYLVLDKLVIGSTSGGFNFWRGHNPDATGSSWKEDGDAVWTTDEMYKAFDAEAVLDKNIEQHYSDFHTRLAISWIKDHPKEEAVLLLKKPILLWGIDWYSDKARSAPYILLYGMTVILSLIGMRHARHVDQTLAYHAFRSTIVTWMVLYTMIVMVFFTLPRLQVLLIGIYFPFVVLGVDRILVRYGLSAFKTQESNTLSTRLISD
jgi:hypothetical protein